MIGQSMNSMRNACMGGLLSPDCGMIWDDTIRLRSFPRRQPAHHVDEDRDEDEDDADEEAHRLSLLSPRYYGASGAGPSSPRSSDLSGRLSIEVVWVLLGEVDAGVGAAQLDRHGVVGPGGCFGGSVVGYAPALSVDEGHPPSAVRRPVYPLVADAVGLQGRLDAGGQSL